MKKIIVSLSTPPNTHLTGLLLSMSRNWLSQKGIEVSFIFSKHPYLFDTPAMHVATGQAHIGVGSPQMLFSFHTHAYQVPLKAVSAPVQQNFYTYATLGSKNMCAFEDFNGKRFAAKNTWGQIDELRYLISKENNQSFIQSENTQGIISLVKEEADIAFVNQAWEGILSEQQGLEIQYTSRCSEDLVMGYDTIYFVHPDILAAEEEVFKVFFDCLNKAYIEASKKPEAVALELHEAYKNTYEHFDNLPLLQKSMDIMHKSFVDKENRWGWMNPYLWQEFLLANKRIQKEIRGVSDKRYETAYATEIFTNQLLPYR